MAQRTDREWPAPRNARHVWALGEDRLKPADARADRLASALPSVIGARGRVEESVVKGRMIQDWLRIERLRPVRSDPNHVLRYSKFSELLQPRCNSKGSGKGGA